MKRSFRAKLGPIQGLVSDVVSGAPERDQCQIRVSSGFVQGDKFRDFQGNSGVKFRVFQGFSGP